MSLRTPAHDSGSGWIANPSLYRTFTNYTPPTFDGAFQDLTANPRPSLEKLFQNVADKLDRDRCIPDAVRSYHYKLQEVADYLGLHFSTISVIARQQANEIQE